MPIPFADTTIVATDSDLVRILLALSIVLVAILIYRQVVR